MNITIPPAALEAGARAVFRVGFDRDPIPDDPVDAERLAFARRYARAAFLAMLENWPGMRHYPDMEVFASKARIILPLTEGDGQ